MAWTRLVVPALLVVLAASASTAQTPAPGDWSVVDAHAAGTPVVVEIVGGQTFEGPLVAVRDVDLTLMVADGRQHTVPKSSVIEVRTRHRVRDPLRNGMTWGGLVGAAAMGAVVAALYATCELTCDAPSVPSVLLPALALGAGGGIGAGAAVDALVTKTLVLYRAGPGGFGGSG